MGTNTFGDTSFWTGFESNLNGPNDLLRLFPNTISNVDSSDNSPLFSTFYDDGDDKPGAREVSNRFWYCCDVVAFQSLNLIFVDTEMLWINDNGFLKCSLANVIIFIAEWCHFVLFFYAALTEGMKVMKIIQCGIRPFPLHAEIYLILRILTTLWTVHGEISKFLANVLWGPFIINCSICPDLFSYKVRNISTTFLVND